MSVSSPSTAEDSVDRILREWADQQLGLDFAPVGVVTRLARVRAHLDAALVEVFEAHDLSAADFAVIVTLRRAGRPFRLAQSSLMAQLGLTSGTISVRLSRLAGKGLVIREPSPDDGRGAVVTLTALGLDMFEQVAPAHLANEDRLLSALTPAEQTQLADLLRRLLLSFEHPRTPSPLGFTVSPAHEARQLRTVVGLSDTPGLLVTNVAPNTPAAGSGLLPGDLLISADGHELRSCESLAQATRRAESSGAAIELTVLRGEAVTTITVESGPLPRTTQAASPPSRTARRRPARPARRA